jgi:SAM-dependent methyltransferase
MRVFKEIVHNALMAVPAVRRFAQKRHTTGIQNDVVAARKAFEFLSSAAPVAGRDVLEIGPGQTLQLLKYALEAGAASATAVDIINYFEEASESTIDGVTLKIYNGRQLPLPTGSADIIWAYDVFEHLHYPNVTLAE